MEFTKPGLGFLLTALAHLFNMNKCIYISGQKWKNEGLQNFIIKVCSPLDPASPLHILCKKTIEDHSIKDLLGQGGKGVEVGVGGTYFYFKNIEDPH